MKIMGRLLSAECKMPSWMKSVLRSKGAFAFDQTETGDDHENV
jgi:hypothetical protein